MRPFAGCDPWLARRAGCARYIEGAHTLWYRVAPSARHERLRLFEVDVVLLEVVLVVNLDRVVEAFGGDQRRDCTLAPSRSISACLHHVAAQTRSKWLIKSTSTLA